MNRNVLYGMAFVFLLGLTFGIIAGRKSVNCPVCPETKESVRVIYADTTKETVKKTNPTPIKVIKPKTYVTMGTELPESKDSLFDGYLIEKPETVVYQDSLDDSYLTIAITDTVAGSIEGRQISYKLKVPLRIETTKTVTREIDKYHNGLYIGIGGGYNHFSVNASYVLKDWTISGGYDLINKSPVVGINRRIF